MQIGGFIKSSLVDYPGKIAAVVFTQGCNFRCPFCHNVELVIPSKFREPVPEEEVTSFLNKRREVLQGVVLTGGEPTIQKGLDDFLCKVKSLGYPIKMDTNGSQPEVLARLIRHRLVDYVAMDIKSSPSRYDNVCGVSVVWEDIQASVDLLLRASIQVEFRTTLVRDFVSEVDLEQIAKQIPASPVWTLQEFVPRDTILAPELLDRRVYSEAEIQELRLRWQRPRPDNEGCKT